MSELRRRLGAWLLKPHAMKMIEQYEEAADAHPSDSSDRQHCWYIAVGIRRVIS